MQKNLKMMIVIMGLFSILLLLIIIGPEINRMVVMADNDPKVSDSGSEKNTTEPAVGKTESIPAVICEITQPKVAFQLKYDKYPLTFTYLLIENDTVNIRKGPSLADPVLKAVPKNEKLNYIETIANEGKWYKVAWQENGQQNVGYVSADVAVKKVFQFDKMYKAIQKVEKAAETGAVTYIGNYHNVKGYAPKYKGGDLDNSGNRRSQSAPGYPNPAEPSEFSYLGDGTLVRVLSSGAEFTRVAVVKDEKVYFVPNKYVATPSAVTTIQKAVVVDRGNQNEVVFEKIGSEWNVISYTLATTGGMDEYRQPTPLGYFFGIEKRERFYYYKDGTTRIQGYAPYAIRFAGGAYLHGVPVNFKFSAQGARIDPGKVEASRTLGTVPLSHKCVRNYTSHAKFLYDGYVQGQMIVIVME